MRYEPFIQYTSRWHRIRVDGHERDKLMSWCSKHPSSNGFHACTEDQIPYRKIDYNDGYYLQFRFESEEDAILFALTWCGEDA
jgi:hypothetical protein